MTGCRDRGDYRCAVDRALPYPLTRPGRLCLLLGLAKVALLVPILGRYGWHRDELYFLAAGRHLAFGYVDFPPLIAVAARAVDATVGPSLVTLRIVCSLIVIAAVVAAGAIAREFGAGPRLQVLAAAAWMLTPFALGGAVLFHPTFLDLAATALLMLTATRLVVTGDPRQWLLFGLWAGVGLEAKYTIGMPIAVFVVGCAVWRRDLLRCRHVLIGILIAVALVAPNIAWQATHHWISADFASSQHAATAGDASPPAYVAQQLAFMGAGAILVVLGVIWLWRRPELRPLALAAAAPALLFALEQGRSYYALPAMLPALVAGCVLLAERRRRRRTFVALGLVHAVALVLVTPLVVPVLPIRQLISTGDWNQSFWKDEIGWHELIAQTATAWNAIPPAERARSTIVAGDYGVAGALALFGPSAGLPPSVSGHLSFQYWRPARLPARSVLLVGFDGGRARGLCRSSRVLGVADNRWHVDNEERGRPLVLCELRRPLGQVWKRDFATARL